VDFLSSNHSELNRYAATQKKKKKAQWPEPARKLCRPSDRCLSVKLVPTFADRGMCAVSVADPYVHTLGFLNRSRYFFFQVAPELHSRGWVYSVPEPLLLRNPGSAANRTRTSGSVARNSDHKITVRLEGWCKFNGIRNRTRDLPAC
jgi:hypothetical protein